MSNGLIPAGRRTEILSLIQERRFISVDELSKHFNVSVITIRRDLAELESEGLLERTHGGAILTRHIKNESSFSEKDSERLDAKESIAALAADFIEPGDTVFVNSGSTTSHLIRVIAALPSIRIVTNNVIAAASANPAEDTEIILIGGVLRTNSGCTVGDFASQLIRQISGTKLFIGADGISLKSGITSPVSQEAAVTKMMIEQTAGPVIVAADSSKVGRVTTFFTTALSNADVLLTDRDFDESFRPDFEEAGIRIIKEGCKG